jgi:hypothetical protein
MGPTKAESWPYLVHRTWFAKSYSKAWMFHASKQNRPTLLVEVSLGNNTIHIKYEFTMGQNMNIRNIILHKPLYKVM